MVHLQYKGRTQLIFLIFLVYITVASSLFYLVRNASLVLKFKVLVVTSHFQAMAYDVNIQDQNAMLCYAKSLQSCPTLCKPMDCSLPGSSIHGIFQARVLEWGAIAFSINMVKF